MRKYFLILTASAVGALCASAQTSEEMPSSPPPASPPAYISWYHPTDAGKLNSKIL